MSKIGQYIVDNNLEVIPCSRFTKDGFTVATYPEDDFEWTEGDKMWDSVQEWKDLFKDDPVLF